MVKYDLSNVPDDAAEEILRLAEATLASTIEFGLASDQRANVQAGIFGALAAAALALLATIWSDSNEVAPPVLTGMCTLILSSLVASMLSVWAAAPIDFLPAGYHPKKVMHLTERSWIVRYAAEDIAQRIDTNQLALERSAKITLWATWIGISSVPLASAVALATSAIPCLS